MSRTDIYHNKFMIETKPDSLISHYMGKTSLRNKAGEENVSTATKRGWGKLSKKKGEERHIIHTIRYPSDYFPLS